MSKTIHGATRFQKAANSGVSHYRPEIDGLRTLAILPVLFFHAGVAGFSGGFVGVDIFFVISGFLITGIIADDLERNRFSIWQFYERRARRILPALIFFLALTAIAAWFLLLPKFYADFSGSLIAVATFTSNLYFWKHSGYFENSALLRPLLHTWSLAVEEQFYIFMPIAMWIIHGLPVRLRLVVVAVAAALSLALSVYATGVAPTANFFLLPTRAWELLVGSLLAISRFRFGTKLPGNVCGIIGFLMIAVAVLVYSEATPFPGLAALLPCIGAALIIMGGHDGVVGRMLSTKPLVFVGKISYSLYLVHWPVAVFIRYVTLEVPTPLHSFSIIVISFVLAIVSWRFIETPFRSGRTAVQGANRRVLVNSVLALSLVLVVGQAGKQAAGFPGRFPQYTEMTRKQAQSESGEPSETWRNGKCFFEEGEAFQNWKAEDCTLISHLGPATLLWGDSFAAHYVPGIVAAADTIPGTVYEYTYAGCPPVLAYYSYARPACKQFNEDAIKHIEELNVKTVILSGRWIDLQSRGLDLLGETVDKLKELGIRTVVIGQSPAFVTDVDVIAFANKEERSDHASWFTLVDSGFNTRLREASHGASFVDPISEECTGEKCPYIQDGRLLYFDAGHLSNYGSKQVVKTLLSSILGTNTAPSK